jgi:hypothetical protein
VVPSIFGKFLPRLQVFGWYLHPTHTRRNWHLFGGCWGRDLLGRNFCSPPAPQAPAKDNSNTFSYLFLAFKDIQFFLHFDHMQSHFLYFLKENLVQFPKISAVFGYFFGA